MKKSQIAILGILGVGVLVVLVVAAVLAISLLNEIDSQAQAPPATEITQEMGTTKAATAPEAVEEIEAETEAEITVIPVEGPMEINGPFVGMTPDEIRALLAGPHSGWLPLPVDPGRTTQIRMLASPGMGGTLYITAPAGLEILSPCDGVMDWDRLSSGSLSMEEKFRLGDVAYGLTATQYDAVFDDPNAAPVEWLVVSFYNEDAGNYYSVEEMEELGFHLTSSIGPERHGSEIRIGRLLTRLKVGGEVAVAVRDNSEEGKREDECYKFSPDDLLRDANGNIVYVISP